MGKINRDINVLISDYILLKIRSCSLLTLRSNNDIVAYTLWVDQFCRI